MRRMDDTELRRYRQRFLAADLGFRYRSYVMSPEEVLAMLRAHEKSLHHRSVRRATSMLVRSS